MFLIYEIHLFFRLVDYKTFRLIHLFLLRSITKFNFSFRENRTFS